MKKFVLLLFILPNISFACIGNIIAFKGLNDNFDNEAFVEYSNFVGYCGVTFSHNQTKQAIKFINENKLPYELYGYSKGTESVRTILLTKNLRQPRFVITMGAYKTTDVNFDKFFVPYLNYFDDSGKGQKGPGVFLNVSHDRIQSEVNNFLFKFKK